MIRLAEQVGRSNFGYTFDVVHSSGMRQEPWPHFVGLPPIALVHASDLKLASKRRHTARGDGDVDWPMDNGKLAYREFSGHFILELTTETLSDSPTKTARRSAELPDPMFAAAYESPS